MQPYFSSDKNMYWVFKAIVEANFEHLHFLKWHKPLGRSSSMQTRIPLRTDLIFLLSKGTPNLDAIHKRELATDTIVCYPVGPMNKNATIHKCRKPIDLFQKILHGFTKPNEIVLDCFMGSGTTALACKKSQRRYIGFEINPLYVNLAESRLADIQNEIR